MEITLPFDQIAALIATDSLTKGRLDRITTPISEDRLRLWTSFAKRKIEIFNYKNARLFYVNIAFIGVSYSYPIMDIPNKKLLVGGNALSVLWGSYDPDKSEAFIWLNSAVGLSIPRPMITESLYDGYELIPVADSNVIGNANDLVVSSMDLTGSNYTANYNSLYAEILLLDK